jgi:cytochrome c oxidase subunit II
VGSGNAHGIHGDLPAPWGPGDIEGPDRDIHAAPEAESKGGSLARVSAARTTLKLAVASSGLALVSCTSATSTLDPAGPGAARIERLWWLIFWIATVVFLIVLGFLIVALRRGRRQDVEVSRNVRWGEPFIVISGVVVPAVILIGVFVVSLVDMRSLSRTGSRAALEIEVVSHDWWWEARYPNGAVTANEIHVPVGEPVRLKLLTADVIHSFWVPRLQAKVDHVTGRTNYMWLQADRPGRYRGQCAEFCGLQHANMAFYVVAQPSSDFQTWVEQTATPAEPATDAAAAGEQVFMTSTCVGCHAIEGTPADAQVGPDLTHLADRRTLFAGTVPNTRENLAEIIVDPQAVKPGVAMPPTELTADELEDLMDYLQQLD